MTRRNLLATLAGAIATLAAASALYAARSRQPAPVEPAPRATADAALRAEVYVVAPAAVGTTVRTVGTLAANESVAVVSELSRRLVAVHVAEGTEVEKGALLFKLDDSDLRAQLAELDVRRRLAARTEERQRTLLSYDKKALSQQAFDQATAELQIVEAQIAALRVTLAKTEIRAPFRARVGLRRVSEGAWITSETLLTTLQDTSRVKIDFTIPERHAGSIALGQAFHFEVAGHNETLEGHIIALEPVIDAPTRSMLVRGVSDNPAGMLLPGAFASIEVPVEHATDGILVPAQAIIPSAEGNAVYVLRDGRAELREVAIGQRTREAVEIQRGLAIGDTVLTSNLLRMRPGARVEIVAAEQAR